VARITVFNSVTLDGVMQAPGHPDEDRRGGFEHSGWAVPYADPVSTGFAGKSMGTTGGLLLGRWTYEDLHRAWAGRTDNPFRTCWSVHPSSWPPAR
jgi:dihydrofolate reductase